MKKLKLTQLSLLVLFPLWMFYSAAGTLWSNNPWLLLLTFGSFLVVSCRHTKPTHDWTSAAEYLEKLIEISAEYLEKLSLFIKFALTVLNMECTSSRIWRSINVDKFISHNFAQNPRNKFYANFAPILHCNPQLAADMRNVGIGRRNFFSWLKRRSQWPQIHGNSARTPWMWMHFYPFFSLVDQTIGTVHSAHIRAQDERLFVQQFPAGNLHKSMIPILV